MKPLTTCWT